MMTAPMTHAAVVQVEGLLHDYGTRRALRGVTFGVGGGEIFGLLGPNGGGKTTLFRVLSTLLRPTAGRAEIFGLDVVRRAREARASIGVVFQSPAVDRALTVRENLWTQGRLYGLGGRGLREAIDAMLGRVGLLERASDRAQVLSGGLLRRLEIAKGLLHRPRLLLLDEPSTGLDPGARADLWNHLAGLRDRDGVTVLLTTHLMEEAERCDRIGILSEGALVAEGEPRTLKSEIAGEVIVINGRSPEILRREVEERFGVRGAVIDGTLRLEQARGHELIPRLVESFGDRIDSVSVGRPTLLDVFVRRTGHRFWGEARP
jgi:ABC-2 type transport system ATP-binding protein